MRARGEGGGRGFFFALSSSSPPPSPMDAAPLCKIMICISPEALPFHAVEEGRKRRKVWFVFSCTLSLSLVLSSRVFMTKQKTRGRKNFKKKRWGGSNLKLEGKKLISRNVFWSPSLSHYLSLCLSLFPLFSLFPLLSLFPPRQLFILVLVPSNPTGASSGPPPPP